MIQKTKDYSLFKNVVGNRELNNPHLLNLTNSILANNMLAVNPIIVNAEMAIIDGQHRFEVAKANNLDIYYVVLEKATLENVQTLNTYSRNWRLEDYVDSYITTGNQNYVTLKEFSEQYGVGLSLAANLLGGKMLDNDNVVWTIKSGKFKTNNTNIEKASRFMDRIEEIKPYTESNAWRDREFLNAMLKVYKQVSHKKVMHKLSIGRKKIQRQVVLTDYLRSLEDIINYRNVNTLRFF